LRMSSPIGQRKIMITSQSIIHFGHEALRLHRRAGSYCPRAGEVIHRRERRTVGQPRSGDDHRWLAAWTAVCDPNHPAWRSLQLCGHDRLIGGGHGFEHSRILSTDGVERASGIVRRRTEEERSRRSFLCERRRRRRTHRAMREQHTKRGLTRTWMIAPVWR
jgi:hypothetical protein